MKKLRTLQSFIPLRITAAILTVCGLLSSAVAVAGTAQETAHATSRATVLETASHKRIVSLAPSNTELLCTAGGAAQLVGRSSFCDYPPAVEKVDVVGSFQTPNFERLVRIKPDLIILVSGQEAIQNQLHRKHFETCVLANSSLSDISGNLRKLGAMSGHKIDGESAAKKFEKSLLQFRNVIASSKSHPRVFYCVWTHPIMTAGSGSFLNELITACGGTNIATGASGAYPNFSAERLVVADPDVIILPHEAAGQKILKLPPWNCLRAVKTGRIFFLPDQKNDNLSRPTTRVLNGMFWLAGVLHPELTSKLESLKGGDSTAAEVARD